MQLGSVSPPASFWFCSWKGERAFPGMFPRAPSIWTHAAVHTPFATRVQTPALGVAKRRPPPQTAEFRVQMPGSVAHSRCSLSLSRTQCRPVGPIDTVPRYSLPQLAQRLVWSPWTHSPPPWFSSSDPIFSPPERETRGKGLFWLEFDKAQVVLPAASSLVLVGRPPTLGLFTVLSVVLEEEEGQEGTVGPWCCCSTLAAVSGWHWVQSCSLGRVLLYSPRPPNVISPWRLKEPTGTAANVAAWPASSSAPPGVKGPRAPRATSPLRLCVAPVCRSPWPASGSGSTPGLVGLHGHHHHCPK